MFSGFVCVGMLTALGSTTGTFLLITGMVIRKMIRSTNMTSTSGVVLMAAMTVCSSPESGPTLIDINQCLASSPGLLAYRRGRGRRRPGTAHLVAADARAAHQVGMQVAGKVPERVLQAFVAAEEPVVSHDRGHRAQEAEGRHDQRLA